MSDLFFLLLILLAERFLVLDRGINTSQKNTSETKVSVLQARIWVLSLKSVGEDNV